MIKESLLEILRNWRGEYVSGVEISSRLGVSRTAIWKWVKLLRDEGYVIESRSRTGYRLVGIPDLLLPQELGPGLRCLVVGKKIVHAPEVVSTNTWARELAAGGAPEGTVVMADSQTGGKGRLGRKWFSPPGIGIWMSVVFRPQFPPYLAPRLTLTAAVAICRAVEELTGVRPGIKWPNDVLLHNRKVGGILLEMSAEVDRIAYLICGIGLNVNQTRELFPPDLHEKAGSLRTELGREIHRVELARLVLEHLEQEYLELIDGKWHAVLDRWRSFSVTEGKQVSVAFPDGSFTGEATGVDGDGHLIVRRNDGALVTVLTGDVEFLSQAAGGRGT